LPYRLGKAFVYAVLIWLIGFIWGSIVFMTPQLRTIAPIRFVSINPAISFPILVIWVIVTYVIARRYLRRAVDKVGEGLKLGVIFSTMNVLLDFLVLVLLFKAGFTYFISLTVWLGYLLLLIIPWVIGRTMQTRTT